MKKSLTDHFKPALLLKGKKTKKKIKKGKRRYTIPKQLSMIQEQCLGENQQSKDDIKLESMDLTTDVKLMLTDLKDKADQMKVDEP